MLNEGGAGVATQQQGQTGQKASIGRIVTYAVPGGPGPRGKVPAIVQGLNENNSGLTLCVFYLDGPSMQKDVQQGTGPGQWQWPDRN